MKGLETKRMGLGKEEAACRAQLQVHDGEDCGVKEAALVVGLSLVWLYWGG